LERSFCLVVSSGEKLGCALEPLMGTNSIDTRPVLEKYWGSAWQAGHRTGEALGPKLGTALSWELAER
jgi:hypothetical protein